MELLLNLLWLTLLVPAVLIWRRQSLAASFHHQRGFRAIVLLGCLQVLLFPVVSATDDLHPISNEIEESNPSRRTVKQAQGPQSPDWINVGPPLAPPVDFSSFQPANEICGSVSEYLPALPEQLLAGAVRGRAPPLS